MAHGTSKQRIDLKTVGSTAITLGQKAMASSLPVVLSSDQAAIPVSQSGTWNIGTVTTLTGITNALPSGTNLMGKVGIDQTTPGTTNAVSIAQLGANAVAVGTGISSTGTQRVTLATDIAVPVAQFDDTSTTQATEDALATLRVSKNRSLYTSIRDGSSQNNEIGLTVETVDGVNRALVKDKDAYELLENMLVELRTLNSYAMPTLNEGNKYRRMDNMGREIYAVANDRTRIKTSTITLSASTTETTLISGTPGMYNDLLALVIINTSASTNTRVDIRDTTGGTVIFPLQSVGGSVPVGFSLGGVVLPQGTAGASWTAQCGTSTTDVRILAIYSVNI